jgi:hypothetical protein
LRVSILHLPNSNVEIKVNFEINYLSLILNMIIYQLTNVDDKFIMIKCFYSLPTGSIESKLRVNLSMIFCDITKVNNEFITIESSRAWFYVIRT